jgi:protein tyrosine phosphatase (PTP) superfamily phosphohydrolase (DUF442 family)
MTGPTDAARLAGVEAGVTAAAMLWLLTLPLAAQEPSNFVAIDDRLATSAQPTRGQLESLGHDGYGLVINLAPPESAGSFPDEGGLVARQGLVYVNIPVRWQEPRERDFAYFRLALAAADERKVLVHCQKNMRASVFTFLYRVIERGEDPDAALEAIHRIWVPDGVWLDFANAMLAAHGSGYRL